MFYREQSEFDLNSKEETLYVIEKWRSGRRGT